MNGHDPLCPVAPGQMLVGVRICECDLIARVREDERGYAKQTSTAIMAYDEGRRDGYAAALRDAVEAVKGCPCPQGYATHKCSCWSDAVAAIEALGGER